MVAPGEKLPAERELAVQLGISRVTLREAIRALQDAGYLEVRRGRYGGAFVTYVPPVPGAADLRQVVADMGAADLADALTFRMAVECGAAQVLAATELTAGAARHPAPRRGPTWTRRPWRTTAASTPPSTCPSPS